MDYYSEAERLRARECYLIGMPDEMADAWLDGERAALAATPADRAQFFPPTLEDADAAVMDPHQIQAWRAGWKSVPVHPQESR